MLEGLVNINNRKQERFRDRLILMLISQRAAQVLIKAFQSCDLVQESPELKPLKRFSQEVYQKIEWFTTTVKKMAGPNASFLEEELNLEGDKVNNIGSAIDAIAFSKDGLENETKLLTSSNYRRRMFYECWKQAKNITSPQLSIDDEAFNQWYNSQFPQ